MARPKRPALKERDLRGFKYFKLLMPLLKRLHRIGTARDKAGHRELFFDGYVSLLLLYFFNPIVTGLRGLQQATGLNKVQRVLGIGRTSLGSLSEASSVFTAHSLRAIVQELAQYALPLQRGREAEALHNLCAVDGTILTALPKMTWALWKKKHHAVKMHLHFEVFKGVPADATLTPAACSEPAQLQAMLQPGRLYVTDRGYASFKLFDAIVKAGSSFVGRVKDNVRFGVVRERPLTDADRAAGVIRDVELCRVGRRRGRETLRRHWRLVIVRRTKPDGTIETLYLMTNCLDLSADLIAVAYRYRWTVEMSHPDYFSSARLYRGGWAAYNQHSCASAAGALVPGTVQRIARRAIMSDAHVAVPPRAPSRGSLCGR